MGIGGLIEMMRGRQPEKIQAAAMGALGELHLRRADGAALDVVWSCPRRGLYRVRLVTSDADGSRYFSHFGGEGRHRTIAAQLLWLAAQSAVGHAEGTAWEGTASDVAAVATACAEGEGLL